MRTTITHDNIHEWFDDIRLTRLTPLVLGDVGVGKTQSAEEYAKAHNLEGKIVPLDSLYEMDVVGYAVPNKQTRKFDYFPSNLFPVVGDELPEGKDGWLLIIDEFGNCGESMQVGAQRLIFERIVGEKKLHPNAHFIILGNTVESGANANPISRAVLTRCAVAELVTTIEATQKYLNRKKYDPVLVSLYGMVATNMARDDNQDSVPETSLLEGQTACFTPRGYEELCKMVHRKARRTKTDVHSVLTHLTADGTHVLTSTLGSKAAQLFHSAFARMSSEVINWSKDYVMAEGNVPASMDKMHIMPSAIVGTNSKTDWQKWLVNFVHHNADTNTEALHGTLTAIQKAAPEMLRNNQFDLIKSKLGIK